MKKLVLFLALLLPVFPLHAGAGEFTAQVDSRELYEGQYLKLVLTLKGEDVAYEIPFPRPDLLPQLDFQRTMGPSTSRKISIVNGDMTKWNMIKLVHVYVARKAGEITIPSLEYTSKGKTFTTDPVRVRVLEMPEPPKQKDKGEWEPPTDPYLETRLDREEVYVNQKVTVSWYLYSRSPPVDWRPRESPAVGNFLAKDIKTATRLDPLTREFNDKRWHTAFLQSMVLYPIQEGELTIDPFSIVYQVPGRGRNFMGGRVMHQGSVSSKPRTINVKPLPEEGRPPDFSGAVGQFRILLSKTNDTLRADTPFEFSVIVKGTGHPDFISAPVMDVPGHMDLHHDTSDKSIEERGGQVTTTCDFKMYLVPHEKGEYSLGPFRFSYFDPILEKYRTISTEKIDLTVLAGKEPLPRSESEIKDQEIIAPLGKDLRYIKTGSSIEDSGRWLFSSPVVVALQALPFLAVGGAFLIRRRKDRLLQDAGYARKLKAGKRCRQALKAAVRAHRDKDLPLVYSQVYRALTGFIGDSFDRPDSCMTTAEAVETLRSRGVSEETVDQVRQILDECDCARFAPSSLDDESASNLLTRLKEIMAKISREAGT